MPTLTNYHWDDVNDCVLEETDGFGNTIVTYTHEPGAYGPLLSENRAGTTSTHHYDALGSTQFLTDDSGTMTDTYFYDAWGDSVSTTGTSPTPYQWVGRWGYQLDGPTGSFYVRARCYQPTVARWSSIDPLWAFGLTQYYAYCASMPMTKLDPSGLWQQMPDIKSRYLADPGDTLEALVTIANPMLTKKNIACILPLPSSAATEVERAFCRSGILDPHPTDWLFEKPTSCALYDVTNLLPNRPANRVLISVGNDDNGYITAAGTFYAVPAANQHLTSKAAAVAIRNAAQHGLKPITGLVIIGHSSHASMEIGGMWTGIGTETSAMKEALTLQDLYKQQAVNDVKDAFAFNGNLASALAGEMSAGCWFAVNTGANVRLVGCQTKNFANQWATDVLRKNAVAVGTTTYTYVFPNYNGRGVIGMSWGIRPGGQGPIIWLNTSPVSTTVELYNRVKNNYWIDINGTN